MIRFIVATFSEAKPIIDIFNLKKNHNFDKFSVFDSKSISLTISKIGKISSALAVFYTFYEMKSKKNDIWINFGLCGHKDHKIGEIFLVNKLYDNSSSKIFYPFIPDFNFNSISCITLDQKKNNYTKSLHEMESSGFFEATSKFSSKESIYILKIVSDNKDTSIDFTSKKQIYDIIKKHSSILENFCKHLLHMQTKFLENEDEVYEKESLKVFQKITFTYTEKKQMKSLLKLYFLKNRKFKSNLLDFKKNGSYNIQQLKKYLSI